MEDAWSGGQGTARPVNREQQPCEKGARRKTRKDQQQRQRTERNSVKKKKRQKYATGEKGFGKSERLEKRVETVSQGLGDGADPDSKSMNCLSHKGGLGRGLRFNQVSSTNICTLP